MKPSRPCLVCRRLFIPSKASPSHCMEHKPKSNKRKPHYNDPEYRRNRKHLRETIGKCFKCSTPGTPQNKLEIDHIVPVHRGGTNKLVNLRILCQNCHRLRHKLDNAQRHK